MPPDMTMVDPTGKASMFPQTAEVGTGVIAAVAVAGFTILCQDR